MEDDKSLSMIYYLFPRERFLILKKHFFIMDSNPKSGFDLKMATENFAAA